MTHALWVKLIDSVYFSNRVWKIIRTKMDSSFVWIVVFKVQMDLDVFNKYYVFLGYSEWATNNTNEHRPPLMLFHVKDIPVASRYHHNT